MVVLIAYATQRCQQYYVDGQEKPALPRNANISLKKQKTRKAPLRY